MLISQASVAIEKPMRFNVLKLFVSSAATVKTVARLEEVYQCFDRVTILPFKDPDMQTDT